MSLGACRASLLLALAATLAACRLDVAAVAMVDADGSGSAALVVHLDPAALAELDALRVDPTAELTAAAADDPDWTVERSGDGADGLVVTLSRPVADPSGFGAAFRDLASGLAPEDPALLVDVDVVVDDAGAVRIIGTAAFRPPATAGATLDGEPIGPAGSDLSAAVAAGVRSRLVVTLPGRLEAHDADSVDSGTVIWEVPVDGQRDVSAVAVPASGLALVTPWLAAGGFGFVVVVVAVVLMRRRRRIA